MRWAGLIAMRVRMMSGRRRAGAQLDDELTFHVERQAAENRAAGMNDDDARAAALRSFGNPALLRDQARATWSWSSLESLLCDLRYATRTLRRTPGFALTAILIMALGIGANVALFTVVRSVLLKPLPYPNADRVVMLYEEETVHKEGFFPYLPVDAGSFREWQSAARDSAEMAMVSPFQNYNVSADGGKLPERIDAGWCSWNFFSVLGIEPAMGRGFSADDDRPGAPATALLTYSFWQRRFAGDPGIVGKSIWLDSRPYTVIGVFPRSFVYSGAFGGHAIQAWTPVNHEAPPALMTAYGDHEFQVVARLAPGVSMAQLVRRLDALQKQIKASHADPALHDMVTGRTMLDDAVHDYKIPLYALLAATGCMLLIACMNVAGLLVARAATRSREVAIRTALGGGRMRLLRERLVETLLLSAVGGALGMAFAWAALQWLVSARGDMNRVESIQIDAAVALFTVGAVAVCALFSGVISAFSISGKNVLATLQESSRAHSGDHSHAGMRRLLLVLEVGLTVVLLVGAGLFIKSYQRLRAADLGVPQDNVLTMHVSLPDVRYKTPVQPVTFFESLIGRVRALPGVESAGLVSTAPGEGWGGDHGMDVVEHTAVKGQQTDIMVRGADPGYFAAIHLPLLHGRTFTADERLGRANVVVISKLVADTLFPNEDPIGKHLKDSSGDAFQIVGVVGDTRWLPSLPPRVTLYLPIYGNDYSAATIVVRSTRDVESLAIPIQKAIGQMDPDLPVSDVMTLRQAVGKSTIDNQFDTILVLAFAVIALLLAAAGLYGVLSYLVTQRTGEIGIRMALGAPRQRVLGTMLVDGLRPAILGLVVGLAASAALVRQIKSLLYETAPLDPWVFGAVAATLIAVAALACIIPAWRAARLDPVRALRAE